MKKSFKHTLVMLMAIVFAFSTSSCDDWTDTESIDLNNPTIDEQNPQLYEDYLENLRAYKAGDHNVLFVSFDNAEGSPSKQAERLTAIPDSVDYVCLNNPDNLHADLLAEMDKVRKDKSTGIVYSISYDNIEADWQEKVKENPALTEEEGLEYMGEQIDLLLKLSDKYNYDGIVVDYTGRSLVSLVPAELDKYNARQQNLLNRIQAWKEANATKKLVFYGNVQYLVPENMNMLNKCDYIMIKSAASTNADDLSLKIYLAIQAGKDGLPEEGGINPVPTDRFMACVQLPQADDKDKIIGYWNPQASDTDKIVAALGASQWVVQYSPDFSRKGLFVMNIHNDYYNNTYEYIRNVIRIMNPNK